ncbi:MAG: RRXRR domain-containing protein [Candidatus Heimdallarchaeota archaeon]
MSVSVMVLNMRGHPLMPTTPQKARKIITKGQAKIIQRNPKLRWSRMGKASSFYPQFFPRLKRGGFLEEFL